MLMQQLERFSHMFEGNTLQTTLTVLALLIYLFLVHKAVPKLGDIMQNSRLKERSFNQASFSALLIIRIFFIAILLFIWGVDFNSLLIVGSSAIALLGVALFASWSILSNVTAFFILLFSKSFRRGNFIRIVNLDNFVEGYISDINLINTTLITEQRELLIYPNNLLVTQPIIVNPKSHIMTVGKTTDLFVKAKPIRMKRNIR
ncbi:mechanosensitive ion channel domain-containing protein [Catenovulum maritimum]|nr:mechanosensitive ion channel domain-containing protein [Catenovulum maritimum]